MEGASIQLDNKLNEFHLARKELQGEGYLLFYFCPSCGKLLTRSKRDGLFFKPSKKQIAQFKRKLNGVTTIRQVKEVLGEPDHTDGPIVHDKGQKKIYGFKDVKATLVYRRFSNKMDVSVQEDENSHGSITYWPKQNLRSSF